MSTYLELVNLVINESSKEIDELTAGTWDSAEAGRRIYPRIKRNVMQAWKEIQMRRNEWEFMTAELSTVVNPRIKFTGATRAAGAPSAGAIFVGDDSGFTLTVASVSTEEGSWTLGTAVGTIEFVTYDGSRMIPGETFTETAPVADDGEFTYTGMGYYDFADVNSNVREIQWATFAATPESGGPSPVVYMPWDMWYFNQTNYTATTISPPQYVSQDPMGKIVFYPQGLAPFRINFIYLRKPQILVEDDDEPERLPEEYHEWIAWEALMRLAAFDNDSKLYSYAQKYADKFARRAERNLMPLISYRPSPYNV